MKRRNTYATVKVNGKRVRLHRHVLRVTDERVFVDHINRDTQDNRPENLRLATKSQNAENRTKRANASSRFKGVVVRGAKFTVSVTHQRKKYKLGVYDTEEEAATVYDRFIVQHPEFRHPLNFEDRRNDYLLSDKVVPKTRAAQSGYYGVSKQRHTSRWGARVTHQKERIFLGTFSTKEEAAKVVDDYVVEKGLDRTLNFPSRYVAYEPPVSVKTLCVEYPPDKDAVRIIIPSRPNVTCIIDREDYEKVKNYTIVESGCGFGYGAIKVGDMLFLLHRYIMGVNDPHVYVDHIDRSMRGFDNRKKNLRLSNSRLNPTNREKSKIASSIFHGVCKHKNGFYSYVKSHILGWDTCERTMAIRRDLYVMRYLAHEHFKLNFLWDPQDVLFWEEWFEKQGKPLREVTHRKRFVTSCTEGSTNRVKCPPTKAEYDKLRNM